MCCCHGVTFWLKGMDKWFWRSVPSLTFTFFQMIARNWLVWCLVRHEALALGGTNFAESPSDRSADGEHFVSRFNCSEAWRFNFLAEIFWINLTVDAFLFCLFWILTLSSWKSGEGYLFFYEDAWSMVISSQLRFSLIYFPRTNFSSNKKQIHFEVHPLVQVESFAGKDYLYYFISYFVSNFFVVHCLLLALRRYISSRISQLVNFWWWHFNLI